MKLPRNLGGEELAVLLSKYGYQPTRQTGSHLRLTSLVANKENHITIPRHKPLKIGTLGSIIIEVAIQLNMKRQELISTLFTG